MIKVDEALKIILTSIKSIDSEKVKLICALGRVLREDIYSSSDIPGFDNSAMDGYALRAADSAGASKYRPRILEVIEDIKAGDITKKIIKSNQAIRIMTGAPVPKGADSVIMVEDTDKIKNKKSLACQNIKPGQAKIKNNESVKIFKEVKRGENIRRRGEDIKKGELVIEKGRRLTSADIGILASLGRAKVKVARRPKVAILATGDELVGVNEKLAPGKLRSSNSYTLHSQVIDCGVSPKNLGIAKDNSAEIEKKLSQARDCDIILTSGGVSVGDYDLVKDVLAKMGTDIRFWKVAMRPGKPLVFGRMDGIAIFGLPGNPVSSMVSFEVFVRPAILKMLGQSEDERREVKAVLEEDISKKNGVRYFLRANTSWRNGSYFTKTTGPQGSGILKSMAAANSLIILPESGEVYKKGEKVSVRFLY